MPNTLFLDEGQIQGWLDLVVILVGPALALIGVVITVIIMNGQSKKQLKMQNEHAEKLMEQKTNEIEAEYRNRQLDRNFSVGREFLPLSLEAIQGVYIHLGTINELLNDASLISTKDGQGSSSIDLFRKHHETIKGIRKWYNEHRVYIPPAINEGFIGLLNKIHLHLMELLEGTVSGSKRDIWGTFLEKSEETEKTIDTFLKRYSLFD